METSRDRGRAKTDMEEKTSGSLIPSPRKHL